jgi:hypothetical protein
VHSGALPRLSLKQSVGLGLCCGVYACWYLVDFVYRVLLLLLLLLLHMINLRIKKTSKQPQEDEQHLFTEGCRVGRPVFELIFMLR